MIMAELLSSLNFEGLHVRMYIKIKFSDKKNSRGQIDRDYFNTFSRLSKVYLSNKLFKLKYNAKQMKIYALAAAI